MAAAIIVCVSSIQIFRNIASTTSNATALMANLVTRTSTFRSMTLQVTTRGDGDATAELQLPLNRATDGVRDRVLDLLVGEYGVESVAQVVGSDLVRVLPVVVDAADVTHFALRVDHEHFRRVLGAVPARCPLRVVAQVREIEILFLRTLHHVVEAVFGITGGVVRIDRKSTR